LLSPLAVQLATMLGHCTGKTVQQAMQHARCRYTVKLLIQAPGFYWNKWLRHLACIGLYQKFYGRS